MAPSISELHQHLAPISQSNMPIMEFLESSAAKKWATATEKAGRDFRSDVVTVPTPKMMEAIFNASVDDDIYDPAGDASVNELQDKIKRLTGKDAALWVLSGTMGNQICLRTHLTQPPHTVLLDHRAHVQNWESGALPVFSQASVTTVHPANGVHLTLDDVKKNMIADGNSKDSHYLSLHIADPDTVHFPPTRVVALENTLSGTLLPLKDAQEISNFVRNFPVPEETPPIAMHLDGARLFDAVAAEGVSLKDYCECFDSISFCLAKGVGAPMGSVIVGSKRFIERAKWYRKMFGGGTRQPGMMAAAASAALDNALPQLPRVHALTGSVTGTLLQMGLVFALPVQSNMIVVDLEASGLPPTAFVDYCEEEGVAVFPNGRIVFHIQTSDNGVQRLVCAVRRLIADKAAGVHFTDRAVAAGCS